MVEVDLFDEEVEIDNRDSNNTEIHVFGTTLEVSRTTLYNFLGVLALDECGVAIRNSVVTIKLDEEKIEYLLRNMDENNPLEDIEGMLTQEQYQEVYDVYKSFLEIGEEYEWLVADGTYDTIIDNILRAYMNIRYGITMSNDVYDTLHQKLFAHYQERSK